MANQTTDLLYLDPKTDFQLEKPELDSLPKDEQFLEFLEIVERVPTKFSTEDTQYKESELQGLITPSQVDTFRTRLWIMGYLDNDRPPKRAEDAPLIEKPMRAAIRQFRGDVGLGKKSSWIDEETWQIMQELVSFETPFNLGYWQEKPRRQPLLKKYPGLMRAVTLRLAVLGFYDKALTPRQIPEADEIRALLDDFTALNRQLEPDLPNVPAREQELAAITMLYNEDELVLRLNNFYQENSADAILKKKIQRLAVNVAQIELWLLGYEIDLKQNYGMQDRIRITAFKTPRQFDEFNRKERYLSYYALYDFWRDAGLTLNQAIQQADKGLITEFFGKLARLIGGQTILEKGRRRRETQYTDEYVYKVLQEKPRIRSRILDEVDKLGSRMWDGIKRLMNWISQNLGTWTQRLKSWVVNIARYAYHRASESFRYLVETVKRFKASLKYMLPGEVHGSEMPSFGLHISTQLNLTAFLSEGESAPTLASLVHDLHTSADDFRNGIHIVMELIKILIATLSAATGGWLAIIMALIKAYKAIKKLAPDTPPQAAA